MKRSFKNSLWILMSFVFFLIFIMKEGFAEVPTVRICLTGSMVKVYPAYGEAFKNGALLAIQQSKSDRVRFDLKTFYYDNTPLAPREALKKMMEQDCSVILGFNSTSELQAIKSLMNKESSFIISMFGELSSDLKEFSNLLTMQPDPEYLAERLIDHLPEKQKIKNALIVTTIDRPSLVHYRDAYEKLLKKRGTKVTHINILERPFDTTEFKEIYTNAEEPFDTVIVCTRSLPSASIGDWLYEYTKEEERPLFLGTENWGSASVPAFRNALKNKEVTGLFARHNIINDRAPDYKRYFQSYRKNFEKQPAVISGYAFDAVNYIRHLSNKIKNKKGIISPRKLLNAAKQSKYNGITGVRFLPGPTTQYTKSFVIQVSQNGYVPVQ